MATNQNTRTTIVNELGRIFGRIAKEQLQHLTVADLIKLKSLFSEHKQKERSSKAVANIYPNKFWSRDRFEKWLIDVTTHYKGANAIERIALRALRESRERLNTDPYIFTGNPFGDFTYNDPVLALTVSVLRDVFSAYSNQTKLDNVHCIKSCAVPIADQVQNRAKYDSRLKKIVPPPTAISIPKDVIRIAVAGDAAYDNEAQAKVIKMIMSQHQLKPFDLFIHLGDTYFAGRVREFLVNLLGPFAALKDMRKFTLPGNHDLYNGGVGFINAMKIWDQPGRYFAVENDHWIIACLDTALAASDLQRMHGQLDRDQLKWLEEIIATKGDKRILLMSHHCPVSAWSDAKENKSNILNQQIRPHFKNIFAWYWGHDHVCATYPPTTDHDYRGACVGNGAFDEEWPPIVKDPSLYDWMADKRCTCFDKRSPYDRANTLPPHGFLELELTSSHALETYHVENLGRPYTRPPSIP